MKVNKDAVVEEIHVSEVADYPENLPQAKKHNRHVQIALDHLGKQRVVLLAKRTQLTKEIEEIDSAILALE